MTVFDKSKYVPFGIITTGNSKVALSEGDFSTQGIIVVGNYVIDCIGDNRNIITLKEKKQPLCDVPRYIKIDKLIFEKIIENAFNELWEEGEIRQDEKDL